MSDHYCCKRCGQRYDQCTCPPLTGMTIRKGDFDAMFTKGPIEMNTAYVPEPGTLFGVTAINQKGDYEHLLLICVAVDNMMVVADSFWGCETNFKVMLRRKNYEFFPISDAILVALNLQRPPIAKTH